MTIFFTIVFLIVVFSIIIIPSSKGKIYYHDVIYEDDKFSPDYKEDIEDEVESLEERDEHYSVIPKPIPKPIDATTARIKAEKRNKELFQTIRTYIVRREMEYILDEIEHISNFGGFRSTYLIPDDFLNKPEVQDIIERLNKLGYTTEINCFSSSFNRYSIDGYHDKGAIYIKWE